MCSVQYCTCGARTGELGEGKKKYGTCREHVCHLCTFAAHPNCVFCGLFFGFTCHVTVLGPMCHVSVTLYIYLSIYLSIYLYILYVQPYFWHDDPQRCIFFQPGSQQFCSQDTARTSWQSRPYDPPQTFDLHGPAMYAFDDNITTNWYANCRPCPAGTPLGFGP